MLGNCILPAPLTSMGLFFCMTPIFLASVSAVIGIATMSGETKDAAASSLTLPNLGCSNVSAGVRKCQQNRSVNLVPL